MSIPTAAAVAAREAHAVQLLVHTKKKEMLLTHFVLGAHLHLLGVDVPTEAQHLRLPCIKSKCSTAASALYDHQGTVQN